MEQEKQEECRVSVSRETAMMLQALERVNEANSSVLDALAEIYGEVDGGKLFCDMVEPKYEAYKMAIYEHLGVAMENDEYISKIVEQKL